MLIIAIPKSASSSLISTLSRCHGFPDMTGTFRAQHNNDLEAVPDYIPLAKWHSEFVDITDLWAKDTACGTSFCKHHFPPSSKNQILLEHTKKVVLLRSPEEIIKAYYRGDRTGVFPVKSPDFYFHFSFQSWARAADKKGLHASLQKFVDDWENHNGDKLIIYYHELIEEPLKTTNRIEEYFGLSQSQHIDLTKERYTRDQPSLDFFRGIKRLGRHIYFFIRYITGSIKALKN